MKSCPKGDDPNTQHQQNEVQQLSCMDSNDTGTFQVGFRGQTVNVGATTTAVELELALNDLPTIERVSVSYSDPSVFVGAPNLDFDALHICRASEGLINIEFLSPTGNVPEMIITNAVGIDGLLAISTIQDGTKEYITCSGRGLCSYLTGLCSCVSGYASSDGQGNIGSRRDCGAINPYAYDS